MYCIEYREFDLNKENSEKIQNRAARIISKKSNRLKSQDILKELGWMSFNERCNLHIGSIIYKFYNNLAPSYISDILTLRSASRNDKTPKYRTNYGKKTFCYNGSKIWNSIPYDISSANSLTSFKKGYKQYILEISIK